MRLKLLTIGCYYCIAIASALVQRVPQKPTISSSSPSRRAFVSAALGTVLSAPIAFSAAPPATAATDAAASNIPLITTDEFLLVLRDSSRSIAQVEIYNSARVVVRLLDGTAFGLNDVVESSTDPRSTLKVAALCREYKVPCKFVDIELALLNSATTKRKNYANSRVQEANAREKERLERIQQDEQQRLSELQRMEQLN